MVWKDECTQLQLTHITNTLVQFVEKIPEHCFASMLTNHSVQAQIHFTNVRPRFQPRQVHAVYTMHTYTCRTIYTGTAWGVTSSVPTLHRCYMYAMCSSVARLVMVFNFESLTVSTIAHKHKTQYDPVVVVQPCVACFDAHYVSSFLFPFSSSVTFIFPTVQLSWCIIMSSINNNYKVLKDNQVCVWLGVTLE